LKQTHIKQAEVIARITKMHEKNLKKASHPSLEMKNEAHYASSRSWHQPHGKMKAA
jgi:hypothetical protein